MAAHPERIVENNLLVSTGNPAIKIKVSDDFVYLGNLQFILYGIASADVFVFVQASNRQVQRYLIVQFESYLDTNDYIYNYKPHDLVQLGEHEYIHDTFVGPLSDDMENVESDSAQTLRFVLAKGYTLPNELITSRFVRLLGSDRRSEILFGYNEDLSAPGYKAADISEDSRPKPEYAALANSQLKRAMAAFEVIAG